MTVHLEPGFDGLAKIMFLSGAFSSACNCKQVFSVRIVFVFLYSCNKYENVIGVKMFQASSG
jgi:hypothetical protein